MSGQLTPVFVLLLPVLGALLVLVLGRWPNVREGATLATGGTLLLVVLSLLDPVRAGERPAFSLGEVVPGVPLGLEVEPLGLLFALVASFLWIVTTVYSIGYMRGHHEENQTRFFFFFAISIAGALGVAFAANLFTLFAFYEALTLCTFPLVTHHGTDAARKAGRIYLGILLATSICFQLLAIIWTWRLAGTVDFRPGGILAGTASPARAGRAAGALRLRGGEGRGHALPPLAAGGHGGAHARLGAPARSGGREGRCVHDPQGQRLRLRSGPSHDAALDPRAGVGGGRDPSSSPRWWRFTKDNLKARLAYSTVSQLSYIVLGALLANRLGVIGGGMHIAMHAFGKITLFFGAGAVLVAAHETEISRMRGLGKTMPVDLRAFFVGSLSIIGVPPGGGIVEQVVSWAGHPGGGGGGVARRP